MRRGLTYLTIAALGVSVACASKDVVPVPTLQENGATQQVHPRPQPKNEAEHNVVKPSQEEPRPELYDLIEREMRKQDLWVEEWVRQDFDAKRLPWQVSLSLMQHGGKASLLKTFNEPVAQYNKSTNTMDLPQGRNEADLIDAIDHELWHAIFDDVGDKGLFYSEEFEGPSVEELEKYTKEKVKGEEFDDLHKRTRRAEFFIYLTPTGDDLKKLRKYSSQMGGFVSGVERYLASYRSCEAFSPEDLETFQQAISELKDKRAEFKTKIAEYSEWFIAFLQSLPEDIWETETELLKKSRKEQIAFQNQFRELESECEKADEQLVDMAGRYDKKQASYLEEEIAEAEEELKRVEEMKGAEYEPWAKLLGAAYFKTNTLSGRLSRVQTRAIRRASHRMEFTLRGFNDMSNTLYRINALQSLQDLTNNPNEIIARMVNALYSLHFGPVDEGNYTLTKKDLEWMAEFKYKGKFLFRKGIERYILGLQMIEDGADPADVKKQLEYATSFEHKGKGHNWPAADWTLKGEIPAKTD